MIISTIRNIFTEESVGGITLVNGEWWCHSLEDVYRGIGVKIPKVTCIPPGSYKVGTRHSASFNREVLVLYTEDDGFTIKKDGVKFTYCYNHGGSNASHTSGCILSAFNRINKNHITGTAEHGLFNMVKLALDEGENVSWLIVSDPENIHGLRWDG